MTELSALLPPAAPTTAPATNVMGFTMERRQIASTTAAAVREAAREDPVQALREAHAERNTAEADVSRLIDVLGRAREHRDAIERRRSAADDAARHVAAEAAEGLIAAFSAGASPAAALDDGEAAKAARLARETEIASAAVDRLASELATAQERQRVATWQVRALALARLEVHGVEIAERMLEDQQGMRRRRAHLSRLDVLLATEARAIYGDAVAPPAVIAAATAAIDPPKPYVARGTTEPPNPWGVLLAALIADPEALLA